MSEEQIHAEIKTLQGQLTGNLFEDGETQQKIYELKKQLQPEIEENPELDNYDDEGCLYCGS
tara:strand:+ start:42977 stop:43162 length:186 start_codon:yes stop_codon:yes gene_type:complete